MGARAHGWIVGPCGVLALACGGNGGTSHYSDLVGSNDGGGMFVGLDATAGGSLDAHIEQNDVSVTIVTLSCAGDCATVKAVATGGRPPYSFAWNDGTTDPSRTVCPTSTTAYRVKVTDTGSTGEITRAPQTVEVPLTAAVLACSDGGATAGCDSVASVSPTGANPNGRWSYGWSMSLGSAFSAYSQYVPAASAYGGVIDLWTSSTAGALIPTGYLPAAFVNPSTTAVTFSSFTVQAGQFFVHPGPAGQYSIARWTAPRAGTYSARATFEGIDVGPTTTDVHVQHNGVDIASGNINVAGGGNTFRTSPSVDLAQGDTLDFAVGFGGNGFTADSTALDAVVCSASADGG
jgi:hypothetical protein